MRKLARMPVRKSAKATERSSVTQRSLVVVDMARRRLQVAGRRCWSLFGTFVFSAGLDARWAAVEVEFVSSLFVFFMCPGGRGRRRGRAAGGGRGGDPGGLRARAWC